MSQYHFVNLAGRGVLYGLDKPTGGYFFTEFSTEDEIENDGAEEIVQSRDALTFSELCMFLKSTFNHNISDEDLKSLVLDWKSESNPTPLQYEIQKIFGVDLEKRLERCRQDFI